MMKHKIALLCLIACSAQASLVKINPEKTFVPLRLGKLELFHEGNEFKVLRNNKIHVVENYSLDKPLRDIDSKQLSKILLHHKLHVSEFGADEFQIKPMGQLKGGGAVGATIGCWTGRFVAQAIGYGIVAPIIALPAWVGGPWAYGVAVAGVAGTIAPIVESASMTTAIAGGIIGGVITGPA
ncbi:MAG: hypothetical protein P4L31_00110 [Candidatus Babeliales bacterium]|nr:hypothetical protein [Candidatus Babeliales bacterium]